MAIFFRDSILKSNLQKFLGFLYYRSLNYNLLEFRGDIYLIIHKIRANFPVNYFL